MTPATGILVVFAITYVGIAIGHIPGLKTNRAGIALLGAIGLMVFGGVTTETAVSYVNWPTVFLLFGFFVISAQLCLSGFYDLVAGAIAERLGHPARFLLLLMVTSGGLSTFLNHDIVCFVFTPIVGTALLRKQLNPVPFLIALAISSNIGAGATLIGNPQNMMIGQVAHLDFGRYLLWSLVPVLVAMGATYGIIWQMSRNQLQAVRKPKNEPQAQTYPFNRFHTIKGVVILVIAIGLFFTRLPKEIIALTAAGIHLASTKFHTDDLLKLVDWPILVLFMGLFVVAGAFQSTGYGDQAVRWLAQEGFNLNSPGNLTGHGRHVQSDRQLGHRDAAAQGGQPGAARHGLCAGAGEQFWRQPHHHRQCVQHHRCPAGARDGHKDFLPRFRAAGGSRNARHLGGPARVGGTDKVITGAASSHRGSKGFYSLLDPHEPAGFTAPCFRPSCPRVNLPPRCFG
jgi:Na+/H+ antiporter NhaD/arsenite permease-like protein